MQNGVVGWLPSLPLDALQHFIRNEVYLGMSIGVKHGCQ